MNFLRLLRLGGNAKRKEHRAHEAKRKAHGAKSKDIAVFHYEFLRTVLSVCATRFTLYALLAYLITRSARASTFGGIVRPICFAVVRLITNSNFIGCSTGSSVGLAPLRILST